MDDHASAVSEWIAQGGPDGVDHVTDGVGIVQGGNADGEVDRLERSKPLQHSE